MTARVYTPRVFRWGRAGSVSRPVTAKAPSPHRLPAADGVQTRLRWWAVVLPAVAFAALLLLIVGSGEASAAQSEPTARPVSELLERVQQALLG